jgi:hypothetical protein
MNLYRIKRIQHLTKEYSKDIKVLSVEMKTIFIKKTNKRILLDFDLITIKSLNQFNFESLESNINFKEIRNRSEKSLRISLKNWIVITSFCPRESMTSNYFNFHCFAFVKRVLCHEAWMFRFSNTEKFH